MTIEELSFYGMYRPGINSLPDVERERVIAALVEERPELPEVLRKRQEALEFTRRALASGDYDQMGGDPDLYKYFCQRYRSLVRKSGFVGVVLPRTAFNAKGSEGSGNAVRGLRHAPYRFLAEQQEVDLRYPSSVLHRARCGRTLISKCDPPYRGSWHGQIVS